MNAKPQVIQRTTPGWFNRAICEWMPERTYDDVTGMWEAEEDNVKALSSTREKAEDFVRFILARRPSATSEGETRG